MFEKRAIRKHINKEPKWDKAERWIRGHIVLSIIALVLGVFTLKGVVGAIQAGKPFSVKQIVLSAVSQDIVSDRYGHTNILLLGIGGEGHEGVHLTDTMIVASIDHKKKLIPMLSIPRDLYVDNEYLGYGSRLNGIYELVLDKSEDPEFAMVTLMDEIENLLDIDLHYFAMVDFNGFVEVVDAVGGIEIDLEEEFYDPFYPLPNRYSEGYDPFYLAAGEQKLDGEKALKYVRSRKTTSDFDRARRQQEVLSSLKDKATKIGFLLNPSKIKNLLSAISNNFETNLNWSEMIYLAKLGDQFEEDSVISEVLNDEAYSTGGFLYTPEREFFEGAFVLVPFAGDNSEIQTYAQLLLYHPELYKEPTPIQVLNGTKEPDLAAMSKMYLTRYGFNVVRYGNAFTKEVEETKIFANQELDKIAEKTLDILPSLTFGKVLNEAPTGYSLENFDTEAEIIIELGEDFVEYYNDYDERFYVGFY